MPGKPDYAAVVVGSGPNGLAAAITMQQQGLPVLLIEGADSIGGGLRTKELTLPGFHHDVCSAVHPLGAGSPFFKTLPLHDHGLEYLYPQVSAAHPFDDGSAAVLTASIDETAASLGVDASAYKHLIQPLVNDWPAVAPNVLGPLKISHPLSMARFGLKALPSAMRLSNRFKSEQAKGFLAGMAAHSIQPLTNLATSATALVLLILGHTQGWPVAKGGSVSIANALASYFLSIGGKIETGTYISSLSQLPSANTVLFDVTPKQLLQIAGHKFSSLYNWQLRRYRYGAGVFKIDWALSEPIPFKNHECRKAVTIHVGSTIDEVARYESAIWKGQHPDKPFVLLAQPGVVDSSRAPKGKYTAWGYCHVPAGSTQDMTAAIENQIERFAPGFKDTIIAKHTFNSMQMEQYNPNYIGGDINGGAQNITQLFTRPALRLSPYRTSAKGLYICSSSTPPGGGVHGMCGYHSAKQALKDVFGVGIGTT